MVTKEGCIEEQEPPQLEEGALVRAGIFLRNLKKKKETSKRYEKDDDGNPLYGFKLSKYFWDNAVKNGDMSINEQECVQSDACSIAIHPCASDYYHVVALDLTQINKCLDDHTFAAQYRPVKDPKNSCHFEFLPENGSTQSIHALKTFLDSPFPPGKMPVGEASKKAASDAAAGYQRIVQIRRWIRNPNGELS